MPAFLSTELGGSANQTAAPVGYKPAASVYGARLKRLRASFTLATQTTSDTLVVGTLPAGATFAFGIINASATLGASATVAIGTSASTGKYRAGAVFTAAAPTLFGLVAEQAGAVLAAEETVIVTIGVASLPSSGTFVVDIFYSMPQ